MRSLTRNRCVRLNFEVLEDRSVPAGNVTAVIEVSTGALVITGDQYANDIRIAGDGGTVKVTSGDDLTTINGLASATFSDPTPEALRVDLDKGNNRLSLSSFSVLTSFVIQTGMDDDTISVRDVGLDPDYPICFGMISSGGGNDVLDLYNLATPGTSNQLRVSTGNGDDVVRLGGWQYHLGVFSVDTGLGDDLIEIDIVPINIYTPSLYLYLNIQTGNGDDRVRLAGQMIIGTLSVELGNGNDVLEIDDEADVLIGDATLDGGRGHDAIFGSSLLDDLDRLSISDFEEIVP